MDDRIIEDDDDDIRYENENIQATKNDESSLIDEDKITDSWLLSKFKIYKNLIVIGFAWIFQFTAYQSMANLQSSLNSSEGLGTASLSTIYVALVLSSLLLPPIMIRRLGLKWTILVSQATYTLFIASNVYPRFYTSLPSAVILGLGAAPLWTAKCTYLTETAGYLARITKEPSEAVVNRFFGIFFTMFQTSQIWGNVISSTILKPVIENGSSIAYNISSCGANDCPGGAGSKIKRPKLSTIYLLCGIYVGAAIFAMVIILLFLNTYKRKDLQRREASAFSLVVCTLKHLVKDKYQLLILPMTLWLGFEQGFLGADYTKSFVSCVKGVNYVGLTLICYGVVDALGSTFFGYIMKYVGRLTCICFAAVLHYGLIITMLVWKPQPDQLYVLFILPIVWGICDAAWQTQVNSLYGVIFSGKEEAAFSNFRLWESLGFAIAYAYSNFLCVYVKLYLLLAYLTTAMLGYLIIEFMEWRKRSD